jgi:fructose-1,6-bisphosphatase/inositol monophosphatase family enzyme
MIPESIAHILPHVEIASKIAVAGLDDQTFRTRRLDAEGEILTKTDAEVGEFLRKKLEELFPEANILLESEGAYSSFDPARPFTFAVDPIDGTDAFSQGMPGWCISIGMLDKNLVPTAGIVAAPRFDALFFADIGKPATHNGKEIWRDWPRGEISKQTNIIVPSNVTRHFDLHSFPGSIRNFGGTALQLCLPLILPGVAVGVGNKAYIWDYAAAHAVTTSLGFRFEYLSGGKIDYSEFLNSRAPDFVIVGREENIKKCKPYFVRRYVACCD